MPVETITAVPGVEVGHWTDAEAATGVTVLTFPEPNRAIVDVRGGAPGTREIGTLGDAIKAVTVNAIVFSGGSAFGLAASDGVVAEIEAEGRGAPTPAGPVPIVPSAIVFDLMVGDGSVRPGPAEGAAAYRSRTRAPVTLGSVGAGTGAVVGAWRGPENVRKGGIGSAAVMVDGATVGALVVLNAAGDVFTLEGAPLTGGSHAPLEPSAAARLAEATTLVCIATDARVDDPNELRRAGIRGHDALGACIRPTHTRYDGDSVFVVANGEREVDVDLVHQASFAVVGRAVESAILSATALGGVPAVGGP
jgi:L-aminopeptidase/D-esterase-like protein